MRSVLIALCAFIAGVLLMAAVSGHFPGQKGANAQTAAGLPVATMQPSVSTSPVAASAPAGDDWPADDPSPEQVLYAQPQMVQRALAQLTPRVPGKPNLYLLTFGGDGGEDVFRNEAEYAAQLFSRRFGNTVHPLVLENNPLTLASHPLASWSNLEEALAGLHKVMHPDRDILMLYITTHGDDEHTLLVDMDPLPLDQIGATDLSSILAEHAFKWKVVVVNACYSGGFVPPLRDPGTLVLTSAAADRSSFGCGSDSDATYFGRAWLVDALNRTPDFIQAFKQASNEISQWEKQDRLTPSEPQMAIGNGIAAQLALWRRGAAAGPAVPFRPPRPVAAASQTPSSR